MRLKMMAAASLFALAAACSPATTEAPMPAAVFDTATQQQLATNPLLAEWTGKYGGQPAFDKMDLAQIKPALEAGMAAHLAEIDAIANNPAKASFANTIEAMEKAGEALDRAQTYYGIWGSNLSTPEFRKIQAEMAPKLSEYSSKITQNEKLFGRIKALHDGEASLKLTPHQSRLLKLVYDRFQLNGAELDAVKKARYAAINQELAALHTKFGNNLLADEEGWVTYLTPKQLGGLPASFVASAKAAATELGKPGMYAVTNTRSSMDPFLTYSTERKLREQVWRNYYSRGDNRDEHDNNQVIVDILKLRNERVHLLGYQTYADWQLMDNMATKPAEATALMEAVWKPAVARAHEEVADMQALATKEGAKITIEPWDYRFYAEKVRKAKYDLDSDELKAYLQLDKLREAMFYVAGELFGFAFTQVTDGSIPVFHPDVTVWEVTDKVSGKHIGYWYLDPYARAGKRSGAWASGYRSHSTFDGEETVLSSNNSNFVKPAPGEPLLISYDDADTFFHEFGHALHAMSSNVEYPGLNGGVRDYTEFHSQLLERWLLTPQVVNTYFRHYKTGEPMPQSLIDKINKAATFNQGFATVEFLGSAIMDMRYHTVDPTNLDPRTFEKEELAKLGMPKEIPMRHRSTQFGHIFSSEGYAAGYYGYLWADVLTSDAAEAFAEAPGGCYDKDVGKKLVDNLFAPRNAIDPKEAYRAFRGRDATIDALMRDRGFAPPLGASGQR
ncbi:MAG TPA: M3 family metallopeptidase [Hyphomonadaceae bacterium]|jgi:peptidyl-dipeptidase Dcp|nr:M3 family metallopeptidase [Hyphomonadaceae bacterium]